MKTAVDNASDRAQVRKADQRRKRQEKLDQMDLAKLLEMPEGRRTLWRILEHAGVFRSGWADGSLIFFNEGKRDVGLYLLRLMAEADPNALVRMMQEYSADQARAREDQKPEDTKGLDLEGSTLDE